MNISHLLRTLAALFRGNARLSRPRHVAHRKAGLKRMNRAVYGWQGCAVTLAACICAFGQLAGAAPDGYQAVLAQPAFKLGPALLNLLPRLTISGKSTKADLGSFDVFSCSGANSSRSCGLNTDGLALSAIGAPAPGSLIEYGQGVAVYIGISVAAAVLAMLALSYFIIVRYCCCCCAPTRCVCLRCGTKNPTAKAGCCSCGFRASKTDGKLGYSCCDRWGARLFMIIFIAAGT